MQWYIEKRWPSEWIKNCKAAYNRVWKTYKPANGNELVPELHHPSTGLFDTQKLFGSLAEPTRRKDELQRYLAEPRVNPELIEQDSSGNGILNWWKVIQ